MMKRMLDDLYQADVVDEGIFKAWRDERVRRLAASYRVALSSLAPSEVAVL
jgi:hypothetical protein